MQPERLRERNALPEAPTVVLLPQNEQHLETAALLSPGIAAAGLQPEIVLMDGLFHQGISSAGLPENVRLRHLTMTLRTPFYRLDPIRQLDVVRRAWRPVAKAVGRPRVVVAFNDGALQRVAFRAAKTARVVIVIDGMISDYDEPPGLLAPMRASLKRLGRRVRSTSLGIVLPSDVGLSPVARVLVVGEHSARVLQKMGAQAEKIVATGLPRWPNRTDDRPARLRRIVYLSGAFAWHGRRASGAAQLEDASLLASLCESMGLELGVRVHPRDDPAPWRSRRLPLIEPGSETMHESILGGDLVLAMVSTGLLEAISLGRIARSLILTDDFSLYRRSFVTDPMFEVIRSVDRLEQTLRRYQQDGLPAAEYERQQQGLFRYVAATGSDAADRIVREITELID